MRTGRSLTICLTLLPGGGVSPKKAEIKKIPPKKKIGSPPLPPQNWRPPEKLETPPKIGDPLGPDPPPPRKNWRPPRPDSPPSTDLQGMLGYPPTPDWPARHAGIPTPLWTDTRLWKYYLGPTSLRPVNMQTRQLDTHIIDRLVVTNNSVSNQ